MYRIIYVGFLLFLMGCSSSEHKIIIKGRIANVDSTKLWISKPVKDMCYHGFNDRLHIDKEGEFNTVIQVEEIAFISIADIVRYEQFTPYALFIAEPGKTYDVYIDNTKERIEFTVNGDSVYNTIFDLMFRDNVSDFIYSSMTRPFAEVFEITENQYQHEIEKIDRLQKLNKINSKVAGLLTETSKQKMAAIIVFRGSIDLAKLLDGDSTGNNAQINELTKIIEDQINGLNLQTSLARRGRNFSWVSDIVQGYTFGKKNLSRDTIEKLRSDQKLLQVRYDEHTNFNFGNNREALLATFIESNEYFINSKNFQEHLDVVSLFKSEFPNSDFNFYIDDLFQRLSDKAALVNNDITEDYYFLTNFDEKDFGFDGFWKNLEGKKWYVDFWATWCGPCREEFKYIHDIEDLLEKNGYSKLYISTDKLADKEKWIEAIKYYDLKGTHVLVDNDFMQQIKTRVKGRPFNGIPRYFLVNEKGEIINDDAARPSMKSKLESQI